MLPTRKRRRRNQSIGSSRGEVSGTVSSAFLRSIFFAAHSLYFHTCYCSSLCCAYHSSTVVSEAALLPVTFGGSRPVVPGDTTEIPPTPPAPEPADILRVLRALAKRPLQPSFAGPLGGAAAVALLRLRAETFEKKLADGVHTLCGKARGAHRSTMLLSAPGEFMPPCRVCTCRDSMNPVRQFGSRDCCQLLTDQGSGRKVEGG